jgi:hypothetical protein
MLILQKHIGEQTATSVATSQWDFSYPAHAQHRSKNVSTTIDPLQHADTEAKQHQGTYTTFDIRRWAAPATTAVTERRGLHILVSPSIAAASTLSTDQACMVQICTYSGRCIIAHISGTPV